MTHREGKLLGKKLGEPPKCPASPYPQQWFHSPREPLRAPSPNGLALTLPPATFCLSYYLPSLFPHLWNAGKACPAHHPLQPAHHLG